LAASAKLDAGALRAGGRERQRAIRGAAANNPSRGASSHQVLTGARRQRSFVAAHSNRRHKTSRFDNLAASAKLDAGALRAALVRPGRCFATVRTRALERGEAELLLSRISGADVAEDQISTSYALPSSVRSITLAALYRMVNAEG
jgi:hypothetical protein